MGEAYSDLFMSSTRFYFPPGSCLRPGTSTSHQNVRNFLSELSAKTQWCLHCLNAYLCRSKTFFSFISFVCFELNQKCLWHYRENKALKGSVRSIHCRNPFSIPLFVCAVVGSKKKKEKKEAKISVKMLPTGRDCYEFSAPSSLSQCFLLRSALIFWLVFSLNILHIAIKSRLYALGWCNQGITRAIDQ